MKTPYAHQGTNPPEIQASSVTVSEFPLNKHQSFRAEIETINGRSVVRLSRWKSTPTGSKRAGPSFEFGAHRAHAVLQILADVMGVLEAQQLLTDDTDMSVADGKMAVAVASFIRSGSKGGAR